MAGAHAKKQKKDKHSAKKSDPSTKSSSNKTNSPPGGSPPSGLDGNRDPSVPRARSSSNASQEGSRGRAPGTGSSGTRTVINRNLDLGAFASSVVQGHGAKFPTRPKQGNKTGREANVMLNSFPVEQFPTAAIYLYDIVVGKGTEKPGLNKRVWESPTIQDLFKKHNETWLYDGAKLAWSTSGRQENMQIDVDLDLAYGRPPKKDDKGNDKPDIIPINFTRVKQLSFAPLQAYLEGKADWSEHVLEGINFLDHLLRENPSKKFTVIKRSFFQRGEKRENLTGGAEAFKGVYVSVRPVSNGFGQRAALAVNADVMNSAFWLPNHPLNFLCMQTMDRMPDCHALTNALKAGKDSGDGSSNQHFRQLKKLQGIRVYLKHLAKNPKEIEEACKRPLQVKRFVNKTANQHKFTKKDDNGKEQSISVAQHMKEQNVRLEFPDLPLVQMTKEHILVPMELAVTIPNQRYPFKLTATQTTNMLKYAVTTPDTRWNEIQTKLKLLNWPQDPYLNAFGLKISENPTKVKARILPNPKVLFAQQTKDKNPTDPRTSGRWDLRNKVFFETNKQPLQNWAFCIVRDGPLGGRIQKPAVENFVREFVKSYQGHGGKITNTTPPVVEASNPEDAVKIAGNAACKGGGAGVFPQLLVFICPGKDPALHPALKRVAETRYGVLTQYLAYQNVEKAQGQYCSNVAMKVNAKLGGCTARAVGMKGMNGWFSRPTVVIGADVSHGTPGTDNPSIAAVTVSWDKHTVKYHARVQTNGVRTELIEQKNMFNLLGPMLSNWVKQVGGGASPAHIIYVRDGVDEGQYSKLLATEVQHIKEIMQKIDPKSNPKLTVIIGAKRHHIRFFPEPNTGDKNNNALPGTLVETGVTHPFEYDFYLCAHSAIKGTARPVHYHVIMDEANMGVEDLQNWLYECSYQYVRSTTPVSLHPAVYYAHLAAARATAHVQTMESSIGDDRKKRGEFPEDKPLLAFGNERVTDTMWFV